jgi:hypothetical protein
MGCVWRNMMATLPGQPHDSESEQNSLPIEPEFAPVVPGEPNDGEHEPVPKPGE